MINSKLILYAVFMSGLCVGLIMKDITSVAHAEVAGMGLYDLIYDYDFKGAVKKIVEGCYVDEDAISC